MSPRQADLLTAISLLGLMMAVAMTAPRWVAALRAPAGDGEETAAEPGARVAREQTDKEAARHIHVRLYFEAAAAEGLLSEEREIPFSSDLAVQLRAVVDELAKGPVSPSLRPTLPPGTRVLEVFVREGGVAYVDLSSEVASGLAGGSGPELLAVYSVVNTIVANFPATSRVRILVDDQAMPSLAGHVDLAHPLLPDMSLLAVPAASPRAVP